MRGIVARRVLERCVVLASLLGLVACEDAYPELVVVNETRDTIQLRDLSFNGCLWNVVLANGESTFPQRCNPGSDRVHFKKLDTGKLVDGQFLWFNYQTIESFSVDYGEYRRVTIRAEEIEQDFSTAGPYGH